MKKITNIILKTPWYKKMKKGGILMARSLMSHSKYIQGFGVLKDLRKYLEGNFGKRPLVILFTKKIEELLRRSFNETDYDLVFEVFKGECSKREINRLVNVVKERNCDFVIGIGGGKLLDTAKAVAFYTDLPLVIIPSAASTDAPCSALSVIYTEDGVFEEYLVLPKNPDMVLVDTKIIANAPVRLLVAGMGDALSTYFEARACRMSNAKNMSGNYPSESAFTLAKLCYEILLRDGLKAKLAIENRVVTSAVENIIEANTYLCGVGFESGGLAAAHSVHNGFTVLKECHHLYHGEKVSFGTIVQLVVENSSLAEIEEVMRFCISVGLPITLEHMGIENVIPEELMKVAKTACDVGETIHNMPFEVTPELVYASILTAHALGRRFLQIGCL